MSDYFSDEFWTDERLNPWLAGAFDFVGTIDVRSRVVLTIENRDPHALRAIHRRLKLGAIEERLTNRPECVWRVSEPPDVRRLICRMLPYLTIARDSALQALEHLDALDPRRRAREQLGPEIVALWLSGRSQTAIARALGVGVNTVSDAIVKYQRGPSVPDAMIERERSA